jgi:hypothetical protein
MLLAIIPAGTACAGSWHAAHHVLSSKEAPGNAAQVKANVAAWKALGEEGQAKVKDPMTVLYKDVRLEVSWCRTYTMYSGPAHCVSEAVGGIERVVVVRLGRASQGEGPQDGAVQGRAPGGEPDRIPNCNMCVGVTAVPHMLVVGALSCMLSLFDTFHATLQRGRRVLIHQGLCYARIVEGNVDVSVLFPWLQCGCPGGGGPTKSPNGWTWNSGMNKPLTA